MFNDKDKKVVGFVDLVDHNEYYEQHVSDYYLAGRAYSLLFA